LPEGDEHRQGLKERERALWQEHGAAWRASLPPLLRSAIFTRGFVESGQLTVPGFLDNACAIFAETPLRHLKICSSWDIPAGSMATLAASPYLARLASLDVSDQNLGNAEAALLAQSPHAGSLKALLLRRNRIGDVGAVSLASSPHLAGLGTLDLASNQIGEDGTRALQQRFGGRVRLGP
jgi:hypothetical protein